MKALTQNEEGIRKDTREGYPYRSIYVGAPLAGALC
jgi:hypothetical protein